MQFTEDHSTPRSERITDPHKEVLDSSFELVAEARDIAHDDDTLFNCLFDMILDYQKTRFDLLKEGRHG